MKDVHWSDMPKEAGVFGGHTNFGDLCRCRDLRSISRGRIDFESIIRALNDIGYNGLLLIEWEDNGMDREHSAKESCEFVKAVDFESSAISFDDAFQSE